MPTPSWTVSFTTPTASNSPAKACAGHEANRTRRLDQPLSPVTQIHRPARLATRAASFRYGGRHHSGIPGDIIPLYPGDFVGIRNLPSILHREDEVRLMIRRYKGGRNDARPDPPNEYWPIPLNSENDHCKIDLLEIHPGANAARSAVVAG